jgi:hypothetical protein
LYPRNQTKDKACLSTLWYFQTSRPRSTAVCLQTIYRLPEFRINGFSTVSCYCLPEATFPCSAVFANSTLNKHLKYCTQKFHLIKFAQNNSDKTTKYHIRSSYNPSYMLCITFLMPSSGRVQNAPRSVPTVIINLKIESVIYHLSRNGCRAQSEIPKHRVCDINLKYLTMSKMILRQTNRESGCQLMTARSVLQHHSPVCVSST